MNYGAGYFNSALAHDSVVHRYTVAKAVLVVVVIIVVRVCCLSATCPFGFFFGETLLFLLLATSA